MAEYGAEVPLLHVFGWNEAKEMVKMMKKEEFLEELKHYLNVLQDEEQEDILEEYSQHIEMKIESGLSEDEAIKDFGSVRDLAGEILEAYHVKLKDAESEEGRVNQRKKEQKLAAFLKTLPVKACAVNIGRKIFAGIKMVLHGLVMPVYLTGIWLGKQIRKIEESKNQMFFGKMEETENEMPKYGEFIAGRDRDVAEMDDLSGKGSLAEQRNDGEQTEDTAENAAGIKREIQITQAGSTVLRRQAGGKSKAKEKRTRKRTMILTWIAKIIKRMCAGAAAFVIWSGRVIWNCGVICAAVFSAGLGLVFLYVFGVLLILWKQGYPIGGMVIGSLGAVLCFVSLTIFESTFYRGKRHLQKAEEHRQELVLENGIEESRGQEAE